MLIGKKISGRYKLLKMVGGGGMANVYLARDIILEREVAVKILRMDFNNDEEFIKRFNREAQSATSLTHPNIVSIYDVGEDADIYYIVMEYVDGLTLKQYIQKHFPVPVEKALDIMQQIMAAISDAHHNGIIHRDIKPQNILIDDEGNAKITDFGIALALSATNITQTNAVLGSVHYLSPEQARGGMANRKSDIYSLGIVMFELVTGRLPFSGESAVSIALKHLQSETPSPKRWNPEIPQSVENIILKATAKDSYYRYESVDDMEDDIRTALNPERRNERQFAIPEDIDATKAIPIITNNHLASKDETIIAGPEKNTEIFGESKQKLDKNLKKKKKNKQKKKRKKGPFVFTVVLFLILLAAAITYVTVPSLFGPDEVTIPSVEGEELEDAISLLFESGLEIGETIDLEDENMAEGLVIKTDPNEGKVVKEGTKVTIYQSIGKEKIDLTDFVGRNIDDIQPLLDSFQFKDVNTIETVDEEDAGTIIHQVPSGGTAVIPSETEIKFTVSLGPESITLENLLQFNQTQLDNYANDAGITISVSEQYHDTIDAGLVISQSPEASTEIAKGSNVSVVFSKGKKEIPPKTVIKDITIEYEPEILGEAQEVQIFIDDMNNNMTEPYEPPFFITKTETRKLEFTVPHNQNAGYQVIRDGEVILKETIEYPEE
jgi:eukaryotic-like serine/threonine-protein kinase